MALAVFIVGTGVTLAAPKDSLARLFGQRASTWTETMLLLLAAAVNASVWIKRDRLWLPRYVHVLAGLGLTVSALGEWFGGDGSSGSPLRVIYRILLGPAVVYVVFLAYDGVVVAKRENKAPHA